jgi:nucleoside-diphosphate-sugar epimerase
MTIRIAVLGANGVYARHLIPRLVAEGYEVRAVVRRPEAASAARAAGAIVMIADIFDVAQSCDHAARPERTRRFRGERQAARGRRSEFR